MIALIVFLIVAIFGFRKQYQAGAGPFMWGNTIEARRRSLIVTIAIIWFGAASLVWASR